MRWSLATSFCFHGAILVAALVVLPRPDAFQVKPQEAIQVDITKIEDVSKRKAAVKAAEMPVDKPAPKKTEVVKKEEPAPKVAEEVKKAVKEPEPPKPVEADPLKDLIKDTAAKTPEPKKEEVKKAEVKPKEKPKKPEKKKPKLDTDEIAAFLNKVDEEKAAPALATEKLAEPDAGDADRQGTDDTLSADIVDALRQRLYSCWLVQAGAREANIVVKVRFHLNQDGSVQGFPEVLNDGDSLFAATAQSAVSAVMECQSYDFLPADQYDLWREITVKFNPNMMFES